MLSYIIPELSKYAHFLVWSLLPWESTLNRGNLRRKGLCGLDFQITVHRWERLEQELRQKPWAKAACWLVLLLSLRLSYPYLSRGHLTRYGATHSGLVPFTSVINQDSLTDYTTGQPDLAIPWLSVPQLRCLQMTPDSVRWTTEAK